MKTHNVRYIVLHIVPFSNWQSMNYEDKMRFHHAITASGKKIILKHLSSQEGCVDVAFVGPEVSTRYSKPLFCLLLDLWMTRSVANIVTAGKLYNFSSIPTPSMRGWLGLRLSPRIARHIMQLGNLLTLKSHLPPII